MVNVQIQVLVKIGQTKIIHKLLLKDGISNRYGNLLTSSNKYVVLNSIIAILYYSKISVEVLTLS